jgi:transcriptional regulator with XRE-family HTH domain
MTGAGTDLLVIPDSFWKRPETIAALRGRAIGKLLLLVHQYTGASQTQVATACGMTQPKISDIMRGSHKVETLAVFERFAEALGMPDPARITLGLAPRGASRPSRRPSPSTQARDGQAAAPVVPAKTAGDVVSAAAEEVSAESLSLAAEFDPETLTSLWQESVEIARAANRPSLDMFTAARRVRSHAVKLAERTRRPALLSDLYVICGVATALMASSAFDINRWDESDVLAKSAVSYASLAGHSSLRAWTLGLAALLANWRCEPDVALSHFQHGMQIAPPGEPRARLRHIACRSYALLGDAPAMADVLASARSDQADADRHPDSLSGEVGGEFGFGPGRAEACAAAAWLDLGIGHKALEAAQSAMQALTSMPGPRRPVSQVNGVRIDMATACLFKNDLDSSAEAIRPVLAQPASVRNVSLAARLARAQTILLSPAWAKDGQARQLADDIGQWLTTDQELQVRMQVRQRWQESAAHARG